MFYEIGQREYIRESHYYEAVLHRGHLIVSDLVSHFEENLIVNFGNPTL